MVQNKIYKVVSFFDAVAATVIEKLFLVQINFNTTPNIILFLKGNETRNYPFGGRIWPIDRHICILLKLNSSDFFLRWLIKFDKRFPCLRLQLPLWMIIFSLLNFNSYSWQNKFYKIRTLNESSFTSSSFSSTILLSGRISNKKLLVQTYNCKYSQIYINNLLSSTTQ